MIDREQNLRLGDARKLSQMMQGESVPSSGLSKQMAEELLSEDLIWQQVYGSRRKFKLRDANALSIYLAQRYGIQVSLDEWIKVMESGETVSRARQVEVTSRSKAKSTRSFTGFLVKSYQPIETSLYGEPLLINPPQGLSLFIEDFTHFRLADDVTVVGIENGENFQHIEQMRHLFKSLVIPRVRIFAHGCGPFPIPIFILGISILPAFTFSSLNSSLISVLRPASLYLPTSRRVFKRETPSFTTYSTNVLKR